MPTYYFECEKCGASEEFVRSIKEGPPKGVHCVLCEQVDNELVEMIHQLGCNFVLKGDGWPSKEFKGDHAFGIVKDQTDDQMREDSRNQRIVDEVTSVRRQGRAASDDMKKNNPQKYADYQSAVNKGYRAKPKSYSVKGEGLQ